MTTRSEPDTLGFALPREIARVRDEVIPAYEACGDGGTFAVLSLRATLRIAERAIEDGDAVAMVRAYAILKGWTT